MAKYILFKYDNERFASGDHIKMYPVKRIELTEEELESVENALYVFELEKKSTWRKAENFYKLKDKLRKALE